MSLRKHRYTKLECNTILSLRVDNFKIKEIAELINKRFNTNRTDLSISNKLSSLTKRDSINRKLTGRDKLILETIKNNPTNIKESLKDLSFEINVSFYTLYNRYYKHLKHTHPVLTVGSAKGFTNNVKNLKRDINGKLPTPDYNNLQWVLKQILELSKKEIDQIKLLLD